MSKPADLRLTMAEQRRAVISTTWRTGDTPKALAARINRTTAIGTAVSAELVRHDMIALGLWTVKPQHAKRASRRLYHRSKTVQREVAGELALAVLQFEELLDLIATDIHIPLASTVGTRMIAARSQIFHAKQIARQAGVWNPEENPSP